MTDRFDADPHGDWPDRTPLYGHDGRPLLVFTLAASTRDGRPWADGVWRPADIDVEDCTEAVLDAMSGYALSTADTVLADALLAAGSRTLRHAHSMSHPLDALPEHTGNRMVQTEPLSGSGLMDHAEALAAANIRAYPAGHPDHEHETVESAVRELQAIARGEILGPFLDGVSQVGYVESAPVGACLVVDRDGSPPDGGPWIIDVFRDPAIPIKGIGRALLAASLDAARRADLAAMSLAVSHDNANALALYTDLGFRDAGQSLTLALP